MVKTNEYIPDQHTIVQSEILQTNSHKVINEFDTRLKNKMINYHIRQEQKLMYEYKHFNDVHVPYDTLILSLD